MKKRFRLIPLILASLPVLLTGGTFDADAWSKDLRPDHPRLFLNRDQLPELRRRALSGDCAATFARLKQRVDQLPADAPAILRDEVFTVDADGRKKLKNPGMHGEKVFRYNGGDQAAQCALVYLVTGDRAYLEKTKRYLRLFHHVAAYSCDTLQTWLGWLNTCEVNALSAFDWICADLTPAERRELLLPILDYIRDVQEDGKYTFRRAAGWKVAVEGGNYSLPALRWFAAIAGLGTGVDEARCRDFLERGGRLFFEMLDFREAVSAGSGLLATATATYSFSYYPYATFLFFHSARSAFGRDPAADYPQMSDYGDWFDFAAIRYLPDGRFLTYGVGGMIHRDNLVSGNGMYTHLAQAIHFYDRHFPDKTRRMYRIIGQLPKALRHLDGHYVAIPFLLDRFDPARIETGPAVPRDNGTFYAPVPGILISRAGSGDRTTSLLFRCGSQLWVHQHYDELSFIIHRGDFLALDSGSRCNTAHNMYYAPQSVAHNTLLIHADGEPMPSWPKPWGYRPDGRAPDSHGGQSVAGKARPLALLDTGDFLYCAADAAASYGDKCREAVRQLIFVKPDWFILYDRVESARPDQRKEWLIHTQNEPVPLGENRWRADNGGRLFLRTLLPADAEIRPVGGPDRAFFASGRNWPPADRGDEDAYRTAGRWRLEVAPRAAERKTRFLHLLEAADAETDAMVPHRTLREPEFDGVEFTARDGRSWQIRFRRDGEVGARITVRTPDGTVAEDRTLTNRIVRPVLRTQK